jgi:hypothetical protein
VHRDGALRRELTCLPSELAREFCDLPRLLTKFACLLLAHDVHLASMRLERLTLDRDRLIGHSARLALDLSPLLLQLPHDLVNLRAKLLPRAVVQRQANGALDVALRALDTLPDLTLDVVPNGFAGAFRVLLRRADRVFGLALRILHGLGHGSFGVAHRGVER